MAERTLTAADLKALRALKGPQERAFAGRFLAEGEHLVQETMGEGLALALLVASNKAEQYAPLAEAFKGPIHLLPSSQLQSLCDTKAPQGILAVCRLPKAAELAELGPRVLALNAVQDPGNVGTMLRSMDAAGFTGLLLDAQCADAFSPKALRASMGSALRLPICRVPDLAPALDSLPQYAIIASSLAGEDFYQRTPLGENLCLLIGNEGAGLDPALQQRATHRYKLPMEGRAESLNAAVAASVMMYDLLRQRRA